MYSVVLMMALSGGTESADFGHRNKCHGCDGGCTGAVAASCHGSCHGRTRHKKCHGSSGGCHGASACSGSSCHGRKHHSRCHGCHGPSACSGYVGCTGSVGYGSEGCTGGSYVPGTMTPKTMPKGEKVPTPPAKTETSAPATIVVTLPADARLSVDGNLTTSTSERRTLVTPVLEVGSDYVYTLRAEVVRDGRSVVESQQVTVRGGETSNVPFSFSSQSVASR